MAGGPPQAAAPRRLAVRDDVGAGLARERALDALRVGDDRRVAAPLEEAVSRRGSLAPCSPPRSACPRRGRPCLGEGHPVDRPLVRRPEVERDLRHRRRDQQQLRVDQVASSEQARSLSITAATPREVAVLVGDDGDAAAPDRDDDEAGVDQRADRVHLDDAERGRRATTRRQPRPASSRTAQPSSSRRRIAVSSSMNEPIGFDGFANAGSSAATSTCVTTRPRAGRCRGGGSRSPGSARARSRSRLGCPPRRRRAAPRAARAPRARSGAG